MLDFQPLSYWDWSQMDKNSGFSLAIMILFVKGETNQSWASLSFNCVWRDHRLQKHSMPLLKHCSPLPLAAGAKNTVPVTVRFEFPNVNDCCLKKGTQHCQLLSSITWCVSVCEGRAMWQKQKTRHWKAKPE